jgi:hypothetical protein
LESLLFSNFSSSLSSDGFLLNLVKSFSDEIRAAGVLLPKICCNYLRYVGWRLEKGQKKERRGKRTIRKKGRREGKEER